MAEVVGEARTETEVVVRVDRQVMLSIGTEKGAPHVVVLNAGESVTISVPIVARIIGRS